MARTKHAAKTAENEPDANWRAGLDKMRETPTRNRPQAIGPAWLTTLAEKQLETERPTLSRSVPVSWQRGAMLGHYVAEQAAFREPPPCKLLHGHVEQHRENDAWLAAEVGAACRLRLRESVQFFTGFLWALRYRQKPLTGRGDPLTPLIAKIFYWNWDAVQSCTTRAAIAEFVLSKLPPENARGIKANIALKKAFEDRIEIYCKRIGLRTGPRGRPRRK